MGKASKDKGKRGELLLARFLREHGYEARRAVQYCGSAGEAADVVGLPGLHIECKFVERLDIRGALRQAVHDAAAGLLPVVFHKRSHEEWLVTLRAEDFMKIYPEWEAADPEGRETALRRTTMKDNKALDRAEIIAALRAECTECSERHWCKGGTNGVGLYCPIQDAADLLERDAEPPNDPLTLEELREALFHKSDWLWCEDLSGDGESGWYKCERLFRWSNITNYGKTWLAYRRKPDGGQ